MCNWFQNKSPTHTFAVDWDTWHVNWVAPCHFNGGFANRKSPVTRRLAQRQLACEGLYFSMQMLHLNIDKQHLSYLDYAIHPYFILSYIIYHAPCRFMWCTYERVSSLMIVYCIRFQTLTTGFGQWFVSWSCFQYLWPNHLYRTFRFNICIHTTNNTHEKK